MRSCAMTAVTMLFATLFAVPALADWGPDLYESSVTVDFEGEASLCVYPNGAGPALNEAFNPWGYEVDATITLELRDGNNDPITGYPREDLWLESVDNGLVFCPLGTMADHDTDQNGQTTWSQPLNAGGHSSANCQVMVNGMPMPGPGLPLHFNSPDLNADLTVTLTDLALFAGYFFGTYDYRADFNFDGTINLSDFALFAEGYLAHCP